MVLCITSFAVSGMGEERSANQFNRLICVVWVWNDEGKVHVLDEVGGVCELVICGP